MRKLFLIMMTLCAVSWSLMAQNRTISGTVVDAGNNEPLIGATVMPIGGGQGAATDIDGNFTLNVPANVKQARISYVGYKEQTVALTNGMTVRLASSSTNLDDVIVVAYGTANKESLTGSVAVVGSKDIEERPVTSVTTALEGSAPGVSVNSSTASPGSAPTIRIRGFNSFNNSAQGPLYVVDGLVFDGNIADINPADVESMSVLKDAASCALYGSRGANGVVLITTKKAKGVGKADVTFTMSLGGYNTAIPLYDRLGANEWMEASLMGYTNGLVSTMGGTYEEQLAKAKGTFVSDYLKGVNIYGMRGEDGAIVPIENSMLFDENGKLVAGATILPGYKDLSYWDAISRTGFRQEYNLNAAGASEKFDVFASMGYLKQDGYVIESDYERFTGRLNANVRPVNYFKAGMNLSASYTTGSTSNVSASSLNSTVNPFQTQFYAPINSVYQHDENGDIIRDDNGKPLYNIEGLNTGDNIIQSTILNKRSNESVTLDGSIYGTAVLPYGFEATVRGGMYRSKWSRKTYMNNQIGAGLSYNGGLSEEFDNYWSYTFQQQINWSHEYGANHIDVLLNHENYKTGSGYSYVYAKDQKVDGILALGNFSTEDMQTQESHSRYGTESYLGRVRYNYDQKYFGEFSLNRDGSSQFYKKNRWGTFWSVGASWIISKENFMQNVNWINYLKLRAAYGSVGNNQAASEYAYLTLYDWTMFGHLMPSQNGNPDLKWEATKTLDLALEGSLFNDRFTFSVGYFDKRNSDLIYSVTLPSSDGSIQASDGTLGYMPSIKMNIGEMKNTGWELQFGVDIIRNANLKWNFNCDFSFIKNEIVRLPNGRDILGQALFQGKSRYENYLYDWAGVDMMTGRSLYRINPYSRDCYTYNDITGELEYSEATYQAKVKGAKEDGSYVVIDGKEYTTNYSYATREFKGSKLPDVYGSFGTNLTWKGIHFGMLFTYSIGGKILNYNYSTLMGFNSQSPSALHKDVLKGWSGIPEGMTEDSPNRINNKMIPQFNSSKSTQDTYSSSSQYLIDASYLSLKNLNLSYDLPSKWMSALKLQGINIGFQMENVFIATKMKGLNPESAINGVVGESGAYYMPARTYTFLLSVKF